MEVDDAVEEGEDVGAEVCHVLHCPVVRVEDGEREEHPARVDEGPCHYGEEVDLADSLASRWWEKHVYLCIWRVN